MRSFSRSREFHRWGRLIKLTKLSAVLLGGMALGVMSAHAQWLSQTFTLKPGWNAIYTHVDVSQSALDDLLPDANGAIAEIWQWRPQFSTAQFIDSPSNPIGTDARWLVWTAARGDTDTLQRLTGNAAYLVRNRTAANVTFTVKGRPVPPAYQWTTTGLNLIGFPTPASAAPNFATFLRPAPGLDLAQYLQNSADVFAYPGGEANTSGPSPVSIRGTYAVQSVTRGSAFWVRGSTNYYNRYYGPVEVAVASSSGVNFRDTLGTYSVRLKNRTATSQTMTLNLLPSESAPAGQTNIVGTPSLLLRGNLNATNLNYSFTVLNGNSVSLTAAGTVGSELEVVLGLDRTAMTNAPGSLYAGILRLTDGGALQQVDLPVSAMVPNASGLWVGQATVDRVGEYLKTYAKTTNTDAATVAATLARAGLASGQQIGTNWVSAAGTGPRWYKAIACSLDGRVAVAGSDYTVAPSNGRLYVTTDYGATWAERESAANRPYKSLACSADGSVMLAGVMGGTLFVSTNSGTTWTARDQTRNWIGVDCSADGRRMVAVVQSGVASGYVYQSVNGGVTWSPVLADAVRNWSCVTMSADGSKIVAAESPGKIWISRDSGATWSASSSPANANWSAITASADGTRLFACVDGGIPVISTDSGVTWTTTSLESRRWLAVAGSTDGQRLGVASLNGSGNIQLSNDGGRTWTAQSPTPSFLGLTMSSDGRRVYGAGYNEAIYTLNRDFTSYAVDADTGLIRDKDGRYISTSTNTSLAKVPSPLPLRLIVHNDAAAGNVTLLQRVFVGPGANSTNSVIATREALLDASQLASARRISAPHLPFSLTNTFWRTATTNFAPGGQVTLTVPLDYNDHASNPFLHTFHPDHDNLDAKFQTVLPVGQESYTVTREIKLTFTTADPNSFRSLTAGAGSRSGLYEETITMTGKAGATRQFRLSGSFNLQRISSVASLTTQ